MRQNSLKNLYLYSKEQETKVRRGIVYSILNKLFDLAPPVLIGIAIDIVVEGSDSFLGSLGIEDRREQLIVLAFLTFVIWALESTFDYVAAVTWRNISQDVEHSLRTDTFKNVLGLDLQYFENKSSGRLMAVLNDDVNQLEKFLDTGANKLLQTLTTVVVIGGTFLYISPLIAIFAFIPIPIIIFGSFKFTKTIPHSRSIFIYVYISVFSRHIPVADALFYIIITLIWQTCLNRAVNVISIAPLIINSNRFNVFENSIIKIVVA